MSVCLYEYLFVCLLSCTNTPTTPYATTSPNTAGIFFLLAPGEEALEQQRMDEIEKGAEFNKRKDQELR